MTLTGLPHTTIDTPAKWAYTRSQASTRLSRKTAITAAMENGAINVWWGTDGKWHANLNRWYMVCEEWTGDTKKEAVDWFMAAIERIA